MDMKEGKVILWEKELQNLRKQGVLLCPLMLIEPGRFPAHVCACDIPLTRALFLQSSTEEGLCLRKGQCLPRLAFPDRIQDESCPPPSLHHKKKRCG